MVADILRLRCSSVSFPPMIWGVFPVGTTPMRPRPSSSGTTTERGATLPGPRRSTGAAARFSRWAGCLRIPTISTMLSEFFSFDRNSARPHPPLLLRPGPAPSFCLPTYTRGKALPLLASSAGATSWQVATTSPRRRETTALFPLGGSDRSNTGIWIVFPEDRRRTRPLRARKFGRVSTPRWKTLTKSP